MTRDFLAGTASDEVALEAIRAVVKGQIAPFEGASRLAGRWVPVEAVGGPAAGELRAIRGDSIGALCDATIEMSNSGSLEEARRLGELTWILAKRFANRDAMVQAAATLAQMMTGDRVATRERLELLEFAVPEVTTWDRPVAVKAAMLANLADARFHETRGDDDRLRATIAACDAALEHAGELDELWLRRVHYIAGSAYNELARGEDDLRAAVAHLRAALRPGASEDEYASTLNNLGNAWRDLGILTADPHALETAITCYNEALHLRRDDRLRLRTEGNRARAERALAELAATPSGGGEPGDAASRELDSLLRSGDDAFHDAQQDGADADALRKRAAADYVAAAALLNRDAPPRVRAEVMHRLAVLFLSWDDDDRLWTGLCFASAVRRLGAADWREVSLARVDAHMGEMLTVIGYLGDPAYLRRGEALLRDAMPILEAEGQPGEFDRVRGLHEMCTSLLEGHA
jgi:hypothetical protein